MNKYTVYGSEELEKKIDSLMELISDRVVETVGRRDLAALVLGGGYGRGEGGVLTDDKGEMRLYNDFDFFVITGNVSSSRRRDINRLLALFPSDCLVAQWNRELVQKGMTPAGRDFLKEALTAMGCADRAAEIQSVPDLIDFDEGRIE